MKEVYIIKADIDCERRGVEDLEGRTFPTLEDFYKDQEVKKMMKRGEVLLEHISDFTTDWNDTDDYGDFLEVGSYFIAYIFIGE